MTSEGKPGGGRHRPAHSDPPAPGATIVPAPRTLPVLVLLAACAGADAADTAGDTADGVATVRFTNVHNYTFEGWLDIPSFPVAAHGDVQVGWSGIDHDLQCHALDPVADIDNVGLMVFPYLDHDEVEAGLARDSLRQVDMGAYVSAEPGDATETALSQLTFFGTPAEIPSQFAQDSGSWLVLLTTGVGVGVGTRTLAFLEPRDDSEVLRAELSGGCELLDHTVDLEALTPLPIPRTGPWLLDWRSLTVTGHGSPLDPTKVTSVRVARFDAPDLATLEGRFLDLEALAAQSWSVPHPAGSTDRLDALVDADGVPFPGFDTDGIWLLALQCDSCPVPAPLALTVLAPT